MGRFSRQEILNRLNQKRMMKKPIIIGAAGIGLIAKVADKAGIDIIMSYCTGPVRLNGNPGKIGYMGYTDSNGVTLEMGNKMISQAKNTPFVGGIGVADPYRDQDRLIDEMLEVGFSGVTNVPTVGGHAGALRQIMEDYGVGFNGEVALIEKCRKRDIFTIAYAFNEEQTRAIVAAGADIICPHVGTTADKSIQYKAVPTVEDAAVKINRMYEVAIKENPDVIVSCHGGPFIDPKSVQKGFDLTQVDAFVGASTVERIPLEAAIFDAVTAFTHLRLNDKTED